MKINYNYWKTKEGRIVKITEMSDAHLMNTILLIDEGLSKLEINFNKYKVEFQSKEWDCPVPFSDVEDFSPKYTILENYKNVMTLELESRIK